MKAGDKVVALAGGVGGSKLAAGLAFSHGGNLTVVVNTADDFEHLGLSICPDIDTMLYTLGGRANREQGWGIEGETWSFLDQLAHLGAPTWFRLGDRDLATHVIRTMRLNEGDSLSKITIDFANRYGIEANILPMTDQRVRTFVMSSDGELPFQDYFVRLHCDIPISGVRFEGAEQSFPSKGLEAVMADPRLSAVIICPSNPYVSIDPILAVSGMRELVTSSPVPKIAVSPIIAGQAVKGPAAKMMRELGHAVDSYGIAEHYRNIIDGIVIHESDANLSDRIVDLGINVSVTDTLMRDDNDRLRLAQHTLDFAKSLL